MALRTGQVDPAQLSIVVLPSRTWAAIPNMKYFVDGVTESLTTDLSRMSGMLVIAATPAFTYKGKSVDVVQIAPPRAAQRYALEGSVPAQRQPHARQRPAHRRRAGNHLWAERFDKRVGDLFDLQDKSSRDCQAIGNAVDRRRGAARRTGAESGFPGPLFPGNGLRTRATRRTTWCRRVNYFERALALDPGTSRRGVGAMSIR